MNRRLGLLAVAVIVALLGTFAVFSYVSQVEAKTLTGAEPVDVLVAAQQVPSGTAGAAIATGQLATIVSMPRKSVPEGALTELDSVSAQTLVSDVFAGEVLLRAKFADQTARTGNLVIPKDKIALSVQLGDPQRVAGFVVPGSEIAIFITVNDPTSGGDGQEATASSDDGQRTRLLLPRTSVIAVGPSTLRPAGEEQAEGAHPVPTAVLTVAVTQEEAERLIHGVSSGQLYLGLLSATSKTGPSAGITIDSLFQ